MTYINLFIKSYNNIALTNQSNSFSGTQTFNNVVVNGALTGNITANFSNYANSSQYANSSTYSNNSNYLDGYNSTTLPHNNLSGVQGTGPDYYHLNFTQYEGVLFTLNSTGSFVPYEGAINNLNMTGFNITASNMFVPIGGSVNWDTNVTANNTKAYMFYNASSMRLEMWVNGKIQQDWGNSTTIYGTATFEADAFFQNLSGVGLLINTNVIVNGNVTSYGDGHFLNIFAGNICYSDGTNCTYINSSIGNLTQAIFDMNNSLYNYTYLVNASLWNYTYLVNQSLYNYTYDVNQSLTNQINNITVNLSNNFYDKLHNVTPITNMTYSLGNSTNWWINIWVGTINTINIFVDTINARWINTGTLNATNITADNIIAGNISGTLSWINISGVPYYLNSTNGSYLYSVNGTVYFNETLNNQTIADIANINAFQQTVIVNVASGTGFNISTPINYYLSQLIVTAPTNTTTFNFQATQTNATGSMIDKDRMQHTGTWNIVKDYSLTNDSVYLKITNASQDGAYTILIKYINAKYPYL
jgi:hypothetical protein